VGVEVTRHRFTKQDWVRFAERLEEGLQALGELLERPGFGTGPTSIGAELELNLVDAAGRPLPRNTAVLRGAQHPQLTVEADRFNVEYNSSPFPLTGRPFTALGAEIEATLAALRASLAKYRGRVVAIGILPTLRSTDLEPGVLTDSARYRALSAGLRRLRRQPFELCISGRDELRVCCDDVTYEGAATSLQIHLKVPPSEFARTYNAAQLATAPVLAVSANSPLFLGRRLWQETRIALFRQAVDERVAPGNEDWRPARVSFGHGWVRRGAHELFAETVALHEALIPQVADEAPLAAMRAGLVPSLAELRLHQGTVWRWNRAVYDPCEGGHLRIEMRALPAGPTVVDMLANAAFLVGLTLALSPDADRFVTRMTFGQARWNFYTAARAGLDAELLWPSDKPPSPALHPVGELALQLLPLARRGLVSAGVDGAEADHLLDVIAARIERRMTGARWQLQALARHGDPVCDAALMATLNRYAELSDGRAPVHEWPEA
jgi:gamma-glutamyl:cysteine ligase YbdK (ATP-grasp superfamily)